MHELIKITSTNVRTLIGKGEKLIKLEEAFDENKIKILKMSE